MTYTVHDEVRQALLEGRGVVALESTIISHGMPYPRNIETARRMGQAIRDRGAVPATVAVMDGALRVGTDTDQMERLGSEDNVAKISLRDIGWAVAGGVVGATTVASTMFAAQRAGVRMFATGGLGGVHRGPGGDVSADLTALGTIPVAVVSAGVKAILDIPMTLEALDTLGVPVIGYETSTFPEFYTRGAEHPVSVRADGPGIVAAILSAHWGSGLTSGAVIANPIPRQHEADKWQIDVAIDAGLAEAAKRKVSGKDITPFLLDFVVQHTGGASLDANIALAINNAAIAADIAVELANSTDKTE